MENETIIIVSVFSAAWLVVFLMAAILFARVSSLRKTISEMQATGRIRVQKLKMENDKNHAFHNPALVPEEELSRRGYSMYMPDDVESGRGTTERQTGGQFVEELTREIDSRQQRHNSSPPFQELNQGFYHQDRQIDPRDTRHRDIDPRDSRQQDFNPRDSRQQDFDPRDSRQQDFDPRDLRQRDFDPRQDVRHSTAPPFLLQAIEENKKKSRLANPVANGNGRQSDTNPNFIY